MSSQLSWALAFCGIWTIGLGLWHIGVPRWFAFREAVEPTGSGPLRALGLYRLGPVAYERRLADVVGLGWVMSNAASMVLVTVGLLDVVWAVGDRTIPIVLGAAWIALWWAVRAASQLLVGRRVLDMQLLALFAAIALLHLLVALLA